MIDLVRSLAVLAEAPDDGHQAIADVLGVPVPTGAEHAELFVLQLFPYASVHLGPEGMLGGEVRDRITGFLRALGMPPTPEPDHLVALLGVYAALLEREADDAHPGWSRAREALLAEHLLPWLPAFIARVLDLGAPSQQAWARLVDAVLQREVARSAMAALLPVHLALAPPMPDPRQEGAAALISGLLSPGRAGMILTGHDLERAARELRLGHRVGERRFVLQSLLAQDPQAVLTWLASAAKAETDRWARHWLAGTAVGEWWRERARSCGQLLTELGAECERALVGASADRSTAGSAASEPFS